MSHKPPSNQRIKKDVLRNAIEEYDGNVSKIARHLRVSRVAVYKMFKKWPDMRELRDEMRTRLVDLAEDKISDLIEEGNVASVIFTLKTQGAERGWKEKFDIEAKVDTEIKIEWGD